MTTGAVRVLSFNVRYDTDEDGDDAWSHRREAVVRLLRYHRPDVLCLQEPLPHQLDAIRDGLDGYEWVAVGRRGDGSGERVPVGYDAERFSLREEETFWLSETPADPGSVGWDGGYPRILTRATLRDDDGTRFHVASVHLDSEGPTARAEGAALARDRLTALDGPVVLAGDCNGTPGSTPYEALTESFADAKEAAECGHHGPTGTFHGFDGDPTERIDYVFVRGCDVRLHATLTDRSDGGYPSDHFPVAADVVPR